MKLKLKKIKSQKVMLKREKTKHEKILSLRVKSKSLESKFIGCLTKKGKKAKFKKIFSESLVLVSNNFGLKPREMLEELFDKLDCLLEIRKLRIKRNTHTVPMPVSTKRRNYLVIKKVLGALNNDKSKVTLGKKLQKEFFLILKGSKDSFSLEEKKKTLKQAFENRANTHFRW